MRKKEDVPKAKGKPKKKSKKIGSSKIDVSNIIESRRGRRSVRAQKGKDKLRKMMDLERQRDRYGI